MGDQTPESAETMGERGGGNRLALWLLLDADRWAVTAVLSAGLWLAVVAVGVAHPTPARVLLSRGDPIETLNQALVTSTVTAVTLVLTLGQLVLSEELGPAGDQQERMDGTLQFRADVADVIGVPISPAEPSAFLRALVDTTGERAAAVRDVVDGELDADADVPLDPFLESVTGNAESVAAHLDGADFGTFSVLRAALDYNYSWKLYAGQRILAEHGDALPEDARAAMADLVDALELFGPAREHIKTLYFRWELSNLSRVLLVVAVPSLAVAVTSLLFFDPRGVVGATVGVDHVLLVIATTTTLSLVPFTALLAYILRIVTVAKRTLSIGPFILRETDRDEDIEWE